MVIGGGGGGHGGGGRGRLYTCYCTVTYTYCCTVSTRMAPANDSCIMMDSNGSRFSVFISCQGQSHKTVTTTESQFQRDRRAKAESN